MLCALDAARRGHQVHLFIDDRRSAGDRIETVESAPAAVVPLVVEFGVLPSQFGVREVHSTRLSAWDGGQPTVSPCPATVHLVRPSLERALFEQADRNLKIRVESSSGCFPTWNGSRWEVGNHEAVFLIDATGRRAITAKARIAPRVRWFASLWEFPRSARHSADKDLAITSLPGGYIYRIASDRVVTLGAVGPKLGKVRIYDDLCALLEELHALWIVSGLRAPSSPTSRPVNSNVQWPADSDCTTGNPILIGDAALAREPLASQGLAATLSDALYAVAAIDSNRLPLLPLRQSEQRASHIKSLRATLAMGRDRTSSEWSEYRRWLDEQSFTQTARVALRGGDLQISRDG
jgi:flavin-dependent dehydrogenase